MTTLRIGNNRTEEMVGDLSALSPVERRFAGCGAHRLVWFAEEGDVLLLPSLPEDGFLEYATELTGTPLDSLRLVVPAPGALGADLLTPDRLADPALHEELRRVLDGRPPRRVLAMTPNASVVALAEALGDGAAVPGHRFHRQNGAALVNSKAVFRAVAAGTGVPLAPGAVVTGRDEAAAEIARLLGQGHCAMLKLEFQAGGFGNEILSPREGVAAIGAQRVVVLPDSAAVEKYLTRRWEWLTGGRGHRLVVERYYPDSVPVYAEFEVADDGCALVGHGEMIMAPVVVGEMVPALALSAEGQDALVAAGRRLCEPFRAMGYRGNLSADAFLTPQGEVLFSETNGRITGSTHVHTAVGARLVGEERRRARVYLERGGWAVPSFRAAVERLAGSGLAFDRESATGAVLICGFGPADGTVRYCLAAEDIETARELEREMLGLFTHRP